MMMVENMYEMYISFMDIVKYVVRNGKFLEEDGSLFCISNRKIVVESRIVICKVIFFFEKGGKIKFMKVNMFIKE